MQGVRHEGKSFVLIQTKGDGNCLFHSLVASDKVNMTDATILRTYIYGKIAEWVSTATPAMEVVYKVYQVLQDDRVSLRDFINRQKQSGQWGSTLDMAFASLVLNVNIISISNMLQKFETFSTMDFFRKIRLENYIHSNAETIYIYHHAFGSPFCPSLNPNHFCTLMPIEDERIDHASEWYERHKSPLVSSKPYIESPMRKKAKHSIKQTSIGLHPTEVTNRLIEDTLLRREKKGSTKQERREKAKEEKQCILSKWIIAGTEEERLKLVQMQEKNSKRSEFELEMKKLADSEENYPPPIIKCVKGLVRREKSWNERAQIIYFYLHPELANKKMYIVRWAYPSLLENTFKNWLKRHDMISRWIPIIKHLKAEDVIHYVENDAAKDRLLQLYTGKRSVDVRKYAARLKENPKVVLVASDRKMVTMLVNKAKKLDQHAYLKKKAKRLNQRDKTKGLKYQEVHEFVWELVQERWKSGQPITKSEVRIQCMKKFSEGDFFVNILDKAGNTNNFYIFLKRSLQRINFTDRKATISQQIPIDWKDQARDGAARVLKTFREKNVGAVMAADETFIHFHERNSRILVPSGEKRVGSAAKFNEKEGCTLMVTMDLLSSSLLRPFIIFTGKFGKTLMKQWQSYKDSIVLFTSNHWMTAETNVLYLRYIADLYKGRGMRVGLVYDHSPTHVCDEVEQALKDINANRPEEEELVVEFIDPCLTSIYQPPDVAVNGPLKKMIREEYHNHVAELFSTSKQSASLNAGDKIPVSRENLVEFIQNAYGKINSVNKKNRWIADSFKTCGLDPWSDTTKKEFEAHLGKLSESRVYQALIDQHTAVQLSAQIHSNRILHS